MSPDVACLLSWSSPSASAAAAFARSRWVASWTTTPARSRGRAESTGTIQRRACGRRCGSGRPRPQRTFRAHDGGPSRSRAQPWRRGRWGLGRCARKRRSYVKPIATLRWAPRAIHLSHESGGVTLASGQPLAGSAAMPSRRVRSPRDRATADARCGGDEEALRDGSRRRCRPRASRLWVRQRRGAEPIGRRILDLICQHNMSP
jgi:hypothetical protein